MYKRTVLSLNGIYYLGVEFFKYYYSSNIRSAGQIRPAKANFLSFDKAV
jgi:hypothetical protein